MKHLRHSMRIVAFFLVLMILLPVGYGGYSLIRYGTRWRTSEYNTYLSSLKNEVIPGNITDRNGVLLATTQISADADGEIVKKRLYAQDAAVRSSVVHVVGDTRGNVKNAAENFLAEYLYGANMTYPERLSQLSGSGMLRGDNVQLTVDSALCAYINSLFPQGHSGAVVVMNYKTGELLAEMSFPNYDPQFTPSVSVYQALNRATRWLSAPGSTYKIVTLTSALQNMQSAAERTFTCTGGVLFGEHQRNVMDYGAAAHGNVSLKNAFAQSCNSTFAILAAELGDKAMRKTAESFGIGDDFTFRDLVVENSAYANSQVALMGADLAWTGAGQNELAVTPLHMCMIASAVANGGVMMEPRLLLSATGVSGIERAPFEPIVYRTVMDPQTAATVREYMRSVVTNGTGRSASVNGLAICGKTGTAEIDTQNQDNAWFVGFIADDRYPYSLCIAVEEAGTGGSIAAPIAQKIFTYLSGK
ncbi:MAG: hypothetical protein IKW00_08960 [Clostridia bacterium]|nr:hypothetical protein [Clostridia bacterium]